MHRLARECVSQRRPVLTQIHWRESAQAVPLKYITAIHETPHNPNLLQMEIRCVLRFPSGSKPCASTLKHHCCCSFFAASVLVHTHSGNGWSGGAAHMQTSDILESASATAAGRAAPPTKLMRLSFDTRDMAEECAQFVNAEKERHWRQCKARIERLLCLPA